MLRVKSVVILKANPGILKLGGGKDVDVAVGRKRESYLGFRNRVGMRKRGRNIVRQKRC